MTFRQLTRYCKEGKVAQVKAFLKNQDIRKKLFENPQLALTVATNHTEVRRTLLESLFTYPYQGNYFNWHSNPIISATALKNLLVIPTIAENIKINDIFVFLNTCAPDKLPLFLAIDYIAKQIADQLDKDLTIRTLRDASPTVIESLMRCPKVAKKIATFIDLGNLKQIASNIVPDNWPEGLGYPITRIMGVTVSGLQRIKPLLSNYYIQLKLKDEINSSQDIVKCFLSVAKSFDQSAIIVSFLSLLDNLQGFEDYTDKYNEERLNLNKLLSECKEKMKQWGVANDVTQLVGQYVTPLYYNQLTREALVREITSADVDLRVASVSLQIS